MRILSDSNVLLRSIQPGHLQHAEADRAITHLLASGDEICIVPQNLYEFWAVATRPVAQNGLALPVARVAGELARLKQLFTLLEDSPAILPEWERLVTTYVVLGRNAHDARFVAAMLIHNVTHLLTFDAGDFKRFPGITVLTPAAVVPPGP
jgi:predicted nucleic acid-binding protein